MNHNLPAGLLNHHYEFFASEDAAVLEAYCLNHGHVIPFEKFSDELINSIDIQISPVKRLAIRAMGVTGRLEEVKQFLVCNYGGFDHKPDMVDGKLQQSEFWACPRRGSCAQEGILCDRLKTDTGNNLSPQEVVVIKRIASGELDKEIAVNLKISKHTVTTHTRNIRRKTGLFRKADITGFAYQKNLIA